MNAINRYELYVLDEGEKSVEVTEDTKIPNAATIKIVKQDHTLANLLRSQLLGYPSVLFAGYKAPHPLQPHFLLKIQTDGSITPAAILEKACTDLIGMVATLESKFKREFTMNNVEGGVQEDAYGVPTSGAQWESGGSYVDLG
ncbi:DNA-directed RNA polymerase II [Dichomitus squalens]|uniref:DNA-directed RNA polymerase II n=2 Tax=Dichomitus squalens TaxID=114155 RepID=A0A4Q9M7V2_9APHY|nr:DNA-directed RNA polymerase II [Dichomitus squalens LYAD-421 SS1]EJF57369.1 DNA-directed RNA polymerase II [Dichomitus squalens LYAD-421 SS1]TBU23154.1 DNA-directed RNA polymerase II [Dichomitus squalens]TBU36805.1 DNA-directed RNA polymerase II [Dichomitus squalens]TBU62644.1 DNA-directed RNA polymerase II [Dichomitus squalens]